MSNSLKEKILSKSRFYFFYESLYEICTFLVTYITYIVEPRYDKLRYF